MFNECQRKYVLHYYHFWDGWLNHAPERTRRLYKLRSLVSVPAWVGIVTHDSIAWSLRYIRDGGDSLALSKVLDYAQNTIRKNWTFSRERKYWSERKPRNPNFLLAPGELLDVVAGHLQVIAFEQGRVETPSPAVVQRICARRGRPGERDELASIRLPVGPGAGSPQGVG